MKKMKICGIYKIISPTNKVYIGQSRDINKRFKDYQNINKTKGQIRLHHSLKKHGIDNHIFEIIEECKFEELNIRERYWQDYYDVLGDKGLNCILTNTDELPGVVSKETRDKISKFHKGKPTPEHVKLKISLNNGKPWLGKTLSKYHKEKISNTLKNITKGSLNHFYGIKHSEDTKLKWEIIGRNAGENNPKSVVVLDIEIGVFYYSIAEASNIYNINYSTLRYNLRTKGKYKNLIKI